MGLKAIIDQISHKGESGYTAGKHIEIGEIKDIAYDISDKRPRRLDIYRQKIAGVLPVILYFHGGMPEGRGRHGRKGICRYFAENGFAVVNVSYGASHGAKFPESFLSAYRAFLWIENYASDYGLDSTSVFVAGDGSGATIGALVAALSVCTELRGKYVLPEPWHPIRGGAFFSGIYDLPFFVKADGEAGYQKKKKFLRSAYGIDIQESSSAADMSAYSPIRHLKDFPPCCLFYSDADTFAAGQGKRAADRLSELDRAFWEFRAEKAPCSHNWQLNYRSDYSKAALRAAVRFLKAARQEEIGYRYFNL